MLTCWLTFILLLFILQVTDLLALSSHEIKGTMSSEKTLIAFNVIQCMLCVDRH